jgi:hypothetical protein
MPFVDVTDIILIEEAAELRELLKDPELQKIHEQFEADKTQNILIKSGKSI